MDDLGEKALLRKHSEKRVAYLQDTIDKLNKKVSLV